MSMNTAKTVKSEVLEPEINKQIEGAKQAVQYFEWLLNAQKATMRLVESQADYAKEQLQKLEEEKAKKFSDE